MRSAFLPYFFLSVLCLRVRRFSTWLSITMPVGSIRSFCLFIWLLLSVCLYFSQFVFLCVCDKVLQVFQFVSVNPPLFVHLSSWLPARACFYLQVVYMYQSLSVRLSVHCPPTAEQELSYYFQHQQKLPVTLTKGPTKF